MEVPKNIFDLECKVVFVCGKKYFCCPICGSEKDVFKHIRDARTHCSDSAMRAKGRERRSISSSRSGFQRKGFA